MLRKEDCNTRNSGKGSGPYYGMPRLFRTPAG